MTDLSDKIVEAGARALAERDGWDFDNMPRPARAPYLGASKAALLAVLPMVAEEIARDAILAAVAMDPEESHYLIRQVEIETAAIRAKAIFSSLIEDLK